MMSASVFVICWAQTAPVPKISSGLQERTSKVTSKRGHLVLASTLKAPAELAGTFFDPLKCDQDGNLYLRLYTDTITAIHKLNPKGERVAIFEPGSATSDLKVDFGLYFSVAPDGYLYQLTFVQEMTRYVFIYKSDGSYKSMIKLQPGFPWNPTQVAPFAGGNILVSGLEYDKDPNSPMWPFTGIFSSDGTLLKEIKLEDDEEIHDLAASGDPHVVPPGHPSSNQAVSLGAMELAADGNIYLMRRLSPAIFYAVSPGGEVVRRFIVDPGQPDYLPDSMHIAGSTIATQFTRSLGGQKLFKIVDLEGHEIATYDDPKGNEKTSLGSAFICYSTNPERFTYLGMTDDAILTLKIAEPH
jgi:hypothetical protein